MNQQLYNEVFNLIIKDIPLNYSDDVFAIAFIGGPCSGKSTTSKLISDKINIPILINDQIRRILEKYNIDPEKNRDIVMKLSYDRIKYMLDNKTSMIIDANALSVYEKLYCLFKEYNSSIYIVELICSAEEINRRLIYRENNFDKNNFSRATTKDYDRIMNSLKEHVVPEKNVFFHINTEENLENQINILLKIISKDRK